jgi:hypothetical protein
MDIGAVADPISNLPLCYNIYLGCHVFPTNLVVKHGQKKKTTRTSENGCLTSQPASRVGILDQGDIRAGGKHPS